MKKSNGIVEIFSLIGLIVLAVALPLLNKTIKSSQDKRNLATETEVTGMCGIINAKCCETGTKCLLGDCDTDGYCKPPFSKPSDGPTPVPTRKNEPTTNPISCGGTMQKCCSVNICNNENDRCRSDGLCHAVWTACLTKGEKSSCEVVYSNRKDGGIDDWLGKVSISVPGDSEGAMSSCIKNCKCNEVNDYCCSRHCNNDLACGIDNKCHTAYTVCQKGKYSCDLVLDKSAEEIGCAKKGNTECYQNNAEGLAFCKSECTCSKVGDKCCLWYWKLSGRMFCENGLECTDDRTCQLPCGTLGKKCCEGDKKCDAGLGCNPADNTCQYVRYECNRRQLDATQQCLPKYDLKTSRPGQCDLPTATCYDYQSICKMQCNDCGKEGSICCTASDGKSRYCTNNLSCNRTPTPGAPGDALCQRQTCGMSGESCPGPGDPEITNTPTPTSTPIISKPKTPATCVKNKGSYSGSGPDVVGGDYDCNGVTNIGDYSVWRKEFVDKQKWKGASNWWTDIDGDGDLNNDSGYSRWRNALFR